MQEWGLAANDAVFLVSRGWSDYVEAVLSELGGWLESTDKESNRSGGDLLIQERALIAKLVGNWITNKLAGILNERGITHPKERITAENMAEFFQLLKQGTINGANGLKLLTLMVQTGSDPSHLLEEHNLGQQNDTGELKAIVTRVIEQNPDQVAQIRTGKVALVKWFVGGVMKASEGKANPEAVEKELLAQLGL
jgi:aspartyl-tRNA(Asn)/glutamyl-tRNA(Gln) amidotransferase subunit B